VIACHFVLADVAVGEPHDPEELIDRWVGDIQINGYVVETVFVLEVRYLPGNGPSEQFCVAISCQSICHFFPPTGQSAASLRVRWIDGFGGYGLEVSSLLDQESRYTN